MTKEKRISCIFVILLLTLLIFGIKQINAVEGYSEDLGQSCGGNEELLIGCFPSSDLSSFYGYIPVVQGGVGFIPFKVTKAGFNWWLFISITFLLSLIIFIYKRKKKCKILPLVYDDEEKKETKDLNTKND